MNKINTFDFDGVIYMGPDFTGIRPCKDDIIITGRPIGESKFVYDILYERDINKMNTENLFNIQISPKFNLG